MRKVTRGWESRGEIITVDMVYGGGRGKGDRKMISCDITKECGRNLVMNPL